MHSTQSGEDVQSDLMFLQLLAWARNSPPGTESSKENYRKPNLSDLEDQNTESEESMAAGEIGRILEGKESERGLPCFSAYNSG